MHIRIYFDKIMSICVYFLGAMPCTFCYPENMSIMVKDYRTPITSRRGCNARIYYGAAAIKHRASVLTKCDARIRIIV